MSDADRDEPIDNSVRRVLRSPPTVPDQRHGGDREHRATAPNRATPRPPTTPDNRRGDDAGGGGPAGPPQRHPSTIPDGRHGRDRGDRDPSASRGSERPVTVPDSRRGADRDDPQPRRDARWGGGDPRAGGFDSRDGGSGGGTRGFGGGEWSARPQDELPARLRIDWEIESRLSSSGGEARLLVVRGRQAHNRDERRVVKIYNPTIQINPLIMREVERLDPAHVVRLLEYFREGDQDVEVLEYIDGGSLDDLIDREGPQLTPDLVDEIIIELAEALATIHQAELVHRDLKPANIMTRTRAPLDLVLTDFGIAVHLEGATRRDASGSKTQAYAAPELTWYETSRASDWWSLGIIIVQIASGRHPFAAEGSNNLASLGQIAKRLMNDDVEDLVIGVPDRYRLLCRGLLRRNMANRWGIDEIRRWRLGDPTLTVEVEETPAGPAFRFAGTGREHYSRREVARVLSDHWTEATASFGRGELQEWLRNACDEQTVLAGIREIDQAYARREITLNDALFRAILIIDPQIVPSYRGYALNPQGLARLAEEALAERAQPAPILRELLEQGCLSTYAEMRGRQWFADVEREWHRQLDSYVVLATLIPEEAKTLLINRIPMAVAAGLRASLPDADAWGTPSRERAKANRLQQRLAPQWYKDLETLIDSTSFTALVGLRVVRSAAEAELREAEQRRNEDRARRLTQGMTAGWIAGGLAIIALALVGIAALFRLF